MSAMSGVDYNNSKNKSLSLGKLIALGGFSAFLSSLDS